MRSNQRGSIARPLPRPMFGHRNAEHPAARLACQGIEAQPTMAQIADHRNENANPPPPGRDEKRSGIRLCVEGQVEGDSRARFESGQSGDGRGGEVRAPAVLRRGQGAPLGAQFFTQLRFHEIRSVEGRWRHPHVPFWTVAPDLSNRWG